ncbi:MAG: hypothetical protein IIU04_08145 [Bacteroidales bacterium]|nr:hypothetical protein [Bacteroidales bacterium]
MRYAKLTGNHLQYAPKIIHWHGMQVINPAQEKLVELGYKPIRYTEPGEAPEGCYMAEFWTETATEIIQGWEAVELPPEDDIDPG